MGANSSVPRTAEFDNPEPRVITLTLPVSERLERLAQQQGDVHRVAEEGDKSQSQLCINCGKNKEQKQIEIVREPKLSPYEKRLLEIEQFNFESKLKELQDAVQKPFDWNEESKEELEALKKDLLKCYRQYHGEALNCYENAKDYQNFVLNAQKKAINNHKKAGGDNNTN